MLRRPVDRLNDPQILDVPGKPQVQTTLFRECPATGSAVSADNRFSQFQAIGRVER